MRRILLGLLLTLSVALVSLLVTLSGSLIASGTGDLTAAAVFWWITIGLLVLAAICLGLLIVTLAVYVVMQGRDQPDHPS